MAGKRKRTDASVDAGKSKKTKAGVTKREREEPSALPEPLETPEDAAEEATTAPSKASKKEKKEKKETKEKKSPKNSKTVKSEEATGDATEDKQTNGGAASTAEEAAAATKGKKNKKNKAEDGTVAAEGKKPKAARFIVFVGNLPYTANASTIRQHFASVKPNAVRCLNKDGQENTCRGFAFIEFTDPTNMRNCLDKMHHSTFNDGLSPARKINVELTAGGGGSKDNRKEKIKARNAQLEVNRAKRIQKEQDEKKASATGKPVAEDGIHPSRRAQMA